MRFPFSMLVRFDVVLPLVAGFIAAACFIACDGRVRLDSAASEPSASAPSAYSSEPPQPSKPHVAQINISGGTPEVGPANILGVASRRSFADLLDLLTRIERGREPQVKGILLVFGSVQPGFVHAQELARVFGRIRKGGMPVVCHANNLGNSSYWLASNACDQVLLDPGGQVETVGIAGQTMYARRLLSELRVDVDMLQVGRFKGGVEPFTRDGPTDEARESLMQTLTSLRSQWLEAIGDARIGAQAYLEGGPYTSDEARAHGLVDDVRFLDEALEIAMSVASVNQVVPRFGPGSRRSEAPEFVGLVRALSGAGLSQGRPHVAILRATGAITMGSGGSLFSDGDGISERDFSRELVRLGRDEAVRAVVLRVDSPGGSALASDLVWRQVMLLRTAKPVVVSIGGMAASGGYYIACAGTRVFAEPTSIVGSIGVFGGKLSINRSLDYVGVSSEIFPASDAPDAAARAAYLSPFAPWDEATRERVSVTMQSVYDLFLGRVSEGRSLSVDQVQVFAEGRIFAAREGLEFGMVDELGGLREATDYALQASGLGPDGLVRLVEESSGIGKLFQLDSDDDEVVGKMAFSAQDVGLRSFAAWAASEELLPYVDAWFPLLRGERALVAVPYALLIR